MNSIATVTRLDQPFYSRLDDHRTLVAERAHKLIARHRQHSGPYHVRFSGIDLTILPEVFCPSYGEGSHLLAKALTASTGDRVLDMGTGSGAIGLIAAAAGASVVAVDIASPAIECARLNARTLGLDGRFDIRTGDLFSALRPTDAFSLIAFNLPVVFWTWIHMVFQ